MYRVMISTSKFIFEYSFVALFCFIANFIELFPKCLHNKISYDIHFNLMGNLEKGVKNKIISSCTTEDQNLLLN